jgi:hypothetical protein
MNTRLTVALLFVMFLIMLTVACNTSNAVTTTTLIEQPIDAVNTTTPTEQSIEEELTQTSVSDPEISGITAEELVKRIGILHAYVRP